jgi:hypothetical protein
VATPDLLEGNCACTDTKVATSLRALAVKSHLIVARADGVGNGRTQTLPTARSQPRDIGRT